MVRNPATLAHTILRRILFTGGSGALSTTAPAGWGAVFAAGGNGRFAGAGSGAGSPAATVSPGWAGISLLADSS